MKWKRNSQENGRRRRNRTFQLVKTRENGIEEEGTAGCLLSWPRTFSLFSRRHGEKKTGEDVAGDDSRCRENHRTCTTIDLNFSRTNVGESFIHRHTTGNCYQQRLTRLQEGNYWSLFSLRIYFSPSFWFTNKTVLFKQFLNIKQNDKIEKNFHMIIRTMKIRTGRMDLKSWLNVVRPRFEIIVIVEKSKEKMLHDFKT